MSEAARDLRAVSPTAGVICPHLGLRDDRATTAGYAHAQQACFHPGKPAMVPLSIQERFCLSGRYPRCPVYQGLVERPPRRPRSLPKVPRRQVIGLVVFVLLVPAALGAWLALTTGDGPSTGDRRVAVTAPAGTLSAAAGVANSNSQSVEGVVAEVESGAEAEGTAEEPAPSEETPSAEGSTGAEAASTGATAEEQLLAWTTLVDWEVQSGDSLFAIANEFATTVEAIALYNGLDADEPIFVGQDLVVPVGFALPLEAGEGGEAEAVAEAPAEEPVEDGAEEPSEQEPGISEEALAELHAWPDLLEWDVQPGDSLFTIALEFGTTVEAIAVYNGLESEEVIFAGQMLVVPVGFALSLQADEAGAEEEAPVPEPAGDAGEEPPEPQTPEEVLAELQAWPDLLEWEVLPGDSLSAIAREFGTTVEAIALYNGIDPQDMLLIGATLVVPLGFTTPLSEASVPD